uniref:Uncharacterized protein n=1 Tax=Panagrellus redivivus TaxID=6233 RepID=A0A7E4UM36_PANRE
MSDPEPQRHHPTSIIPEIKFPLLPCITTTPQVKRNRILQNNGPFRWTWTQVCAKQSSQLGAPKRQSLCTYVRLRPSTVCISFPYCRRQADCCMYLSLLLHVWAWTTQQKPAIDSLHHLRRVGRLPEDDDVADLLNERWKVFFPSVVPRHRDDADYDRRRQSDRCYIRLVIVSPPTRRKAAPHPFHDAFRRVYESLLAFFYVCIVRRRSLGLRENEGFFFSRVEPAQCLFDGTLHGNPLRDKTRKDEDNQIVTKEYRKRDGDCIETRNGRYCEIRS